MVKFFPKFYLTLGSTGNASIYIKDGSGNWQEFIAYEYFKVLKRQNQVSEFDVKVYDVRAAKKSYVKEFADIMFFSENTLILKGRIQKVTYGTGFDAKITGYGSEAKLLDKELIENDNTSATWQSAKRGQWTNISAQTIAKEVLSSNTDGASPWIMQPNTTGLFDTDYGNISVRFEHANRLKALAKIAESIDYEWWITNDVEFNDYFNIGSLRPSSSEATTSQATFKISGSNTNASVTSKETDISNMANYIDFLGRGDGINQLSTSCYNASATFTTLGADITSSDTTITLTDASSFPTSGTIRIMEEQISYTGKSGNNLTGATRGANSTTAREHKKGVYVEKHITVANAEANSSIGDNGLLDYTETNRDIIDLPTLELVASRLLLERKDPIVRIKLNPNEPIQVSRDRQIGEMITITDSESDISGDYRIVSMDYTSDYGYLNLEMEASNKSLTFIEQMQKQQEQNENMQKYMQGATNLYAISAVDNCDDSFPLNMRFYLPSDAVAINSVKLNLKTEKYRSDAQSVTSAPNSQTNTSIWNSNSIGTITKINSPSEVDAHTSVATFNNGLQYTGSGGQTGSRDFKIPYDLTPERTYVYDVDFTNEIYSFDTSYAIDASEALGGNFRFFVAEGFNDIDGIHFGIPGTTKVLGISSTSNATWSTNPLTESTAENLTGTFDRIRVSFSLKNGSGSSKNPTITLSRTNNGVDYTTVQTYNPSLSNGQIYENQEEETTDYRGYVYRLEVSGISGDDNFDTSWIVLNVGTYLKSTDSLNYGIFEDTFPSGTPKVAIAVGTEGSESSVSGSPFTITDGGTQEVDITDAVSGVGTGNWVNVKFTPQDGSDHNRARIEANAHLKIFVESKT